jgi:hypothetical protein
MKKTTSSQSGLLVDIATLRAMAENFLNILEKTEGSEDPRVWKRPRIKRNKKGEETIYYRWYCSWYDGKTVTRYLGSTRKMSEAEALEKAKRLKSERYQNAKGCLSNVDKPN